MKKITLSLIATAMFMSIPAMAQFEDGLLPEGTALTTTATALSKDKVLSVPEGTTYKVGQWIVIETSNITSKSGEAWLNITDADNAPIEKQMVGLSAKSGKVYAQIKTSDACDLLGIGFKIEGDSVTVNKVSLVNPNTTLRDEVLTRAKTVTGSWATSLAVSGMKFDKAVAGDILYVYTSNFTADAQGAFQNSGWAAFAGKPTSNAFGIAGDYWMVLDDAVLAELKSGGVHVYGKNYTIDSVVVKTTRPESTVSTAETTLWTGTHTFNTWDGFSISADMFANVKGGDKMVFVCDSLFDVGSWTWGAQVLVKHASNWGDWMSSEKLAINTPVPAEIIFNLADSVVNELKASGCIIQGMGYRVTKVLLRSEAAAADATLDNTTHVCNNWNGITLAADLFSDATAGDLLVFDVDSTYNVPSGNWTYDEGKIIVKDHTWAEFNPTLALDIPLTTVKEQVTIALNDAAVTEAKANGLILQCMGITISKISLRKVATAIQSLTDDSDASVVGVTYYNVAGQQIEKLQRGVNIIRLQMSNGKVASKKVLVK